MNSIITWMEGTWINQLAMGYAWSWPALETLHFFGMCLLFGPLIIMDLRLVGWEKSAAVAATDKLFPIAMAGFAINLITGIIFCFGNPGRYFINITFQIKMILIVLAGLNFLFYKLRIEQLVHNIGPGEDTPGIAKAIGGSSLVLWLGVLLYGRLIPYFGTG